MINRCNKFVYIDTFFIFMRCMNCVLMQRKKQQDEEEAEMKKAATDAAYQGTVDIIT